MERGLKLAVVVCGFVFIATSAVHAAGECNTRCCDEEYPRIIVQGDAKIETMADKATFNLRVRAEEKKLDRAFEVSTERINSISEKLASNEVKKEDIVNMGYIYRPLYEGKKVFTTLDRPTSYEVIYALKITVYKMDNLGKILAAVSDISETAVYGLDYTSTKIEELKREVLKKAAADAKQKAMNLAEGAGATLGKVLKIESSALSYDRYERRVSMEMSPMAMRKSEFAVKQAPQIESGSLEIQGSCVIVYLIQ